MNTQPNEQKKQLETDIALLDELLGVEARKPGKAAALPAAIRIIESLEPAGGKSIPVFPASYAGDDESTYDLSGIEYDEGETVTRRLKNKDSATRLENDTTKVVRRIKSARLCAVDSPQSQANRMEPAFIEDDELRPLVPQATASIPKRGNDGTESILTLPHRVADFRVRLSNHAETVALAIKAFAKGDALPLLKTFPTSILFGFWDSRGQGTKHARILLSRIDAHNIIPCRRRSQYTGPYSEDEFREVILDHGKEAIRLSESGFTQTPGQSLGGILLDDRIGKIERISVLSLSDIARINCGNPHNLDQTNAARRYLFALAALAEGYERSKGSHRLRSGCELIAIGTPELEFRGAQPSETKAIRELYLTRDRLIAIAKQSMTVLEGETEVKSYAVSSAILKVTAMQDEKEIKKIREEVGNLKLAWEKVERVAKNAEAKAAGDNAKEKDRKAAEDKRKKADEAKNKFEEALNEAGDLWTSNEISENENNGEEAQ